MNLNQARKKLDKYDKKMIKILAKRMAIIPQVAEYKKKNNLPILQTEREEEIIKSKEKLAIELGIDHQLIKKIFQIIFENSRKTQKNIIKK